MTQPRQETGPHLRLPYQVDQLRDADVQHIESVQRELANRTNAERQQMAKDVSAFLRLLSDRIQQNQADPNRTRYQQIEQALRNLETAINARMYDGAENAATYITTPATTMLNEGVGGFTALGRSTYDAYKEGRYGRLFANLGVFAGSAAIIGMGVNWLWNLGESDSEDRAEQGFWKRWTRGGVLGFLGRTLKAVAITGLTLGTGWAIRRFYLNNMDGVSQSETQQRQEQLKATAELNQLAAQNQSISINEARLANADLFALRPFIIVGQNGLQFRRSSGTNARMIVQVGTTNRYEAAITDASGGASFIKINGSEVAASELIAKLGQSTFAGGPVTLQTRNNSTVTLTFTQSGT